MGVCADKNVVAKSALPAHLIDQIGYLSYGMQGMGSFSCVICKNMAMGLR
jgi:hypothetical protein